MSKILFTIVFLGLIGWFIGTALGHPHHSHTGKDSHDHEHQEASYNRLWRHQDRVYIYQQWYHPEHIYFFDGYAYSNYYDGHPYYFYDPRYYYYDEIDPSLHISTFLEN